MIEGAWYDYKVDELFIVTVAYDFSCEAYFEISGDNFLNINVMILTRAYFRGSCEYLGEI